MTHTLDTPATSDNSTDTMRAAVVTEFGAPLKISELELPTPGYGEALVKAGDLRRLPHRSARGAR